MAQLVIITGSPRCDHNCEVMGVRVLSESFATMILVVEPTIVPLPPKPAPNASAHQSGVISIPPSPSPWITGINAIVIGMLSTTADNAATTQMSTAPKSTGETLEARPNKPTTASKTPADSNPPTMMKSDAKKISTLHSIFLSISSRSGCTQTSAQAA